MSKDNLSLPRKTYKILKKQDLFFSLGKSFFIKSYFFIYIFLFVFIVSALLSLTSNFVFSFYESINNSFIQQREADFTITYPKKNLRLVNPAIASEYIYNKLSKENNQLEKKQEIGWKDIFDFDFKISVNFFDNTTMITYKFVTFFTKHQKINKVKYKDFLSIVDASKSNQYYAYIAPNNYYWLKTNKYFKNNLLKTSLSINKNSRSEKLEFIIKGLAMSPEFAYPIINELIINPKKEVFLFIPDKSKRDIDGIKNLFGASFKDDKLKIFIGKTFENAPFEEQYLDIKDSEFAIFGNFKDKYKKKYTNKTKTRILNKLNNNINEWFNEKFSEKNNLEENDNSFVYSSYLQNKNQLSYYKREEIAKKTATYLFYFWITFFIIMIILFFHLSWIIFVRFFQKHSFLIGVLKSNGFSNFLISSLMGGLTVILTTITMLFTFYISHLISFFYFERVFYSYFAVFYEFKKTKIFFLNFSLFWITIFIFLLCLYSVLQKHSVSLIKKSNK